MMAVDNRPNRKTTATISPAAAAGMMPALWSSIRFIATRNRTSQSRNCATHRLCVRRKATSAPSSQ
jgi:hypothetical protein